MGSTQKPFEDSPEFATAKAAYEGRLERENQQCCAKCAHSILISASEDGKGWFQCSAPFPAWASHAATMTTWIGGSDVRAPPRTMSAGDGTKCQVYQKDTQEMP